MNALQALLSAMFLAASSIAAAVANTRVSVHPEASNPLAAEASAYAQAIAESDAADGGGGVVSKLSGNTFQHHCAQLLNWKSSNIVVVGLELGLWFCLAFGLEVLGVQLISATKTAFLNQATVLITPMLVHLSGEHVKKNE